MPGDETTDKSNAPGIKSDSAIEQVLLNVYCPNCQYNLRGLRGREVQCPECGHTCDITKLVCTKWDKPWYKAPGYDKLCLPFYWIFAGISIGPILFGVITFLLRVNVIIYYPFIALAIYLLCFIPAYRLFKSKRGIWLSLLIHIVAIGFFLSIPIFILIDVILIIQLELLDRPLTLTACILASLIGCFFSIKYSRRADRYVAQQCIDQYLRQFHD